MQRLCKPLGDSHNFNQWVELIETDRGLRVKKPRPVYWEWLFLDPQSVFRSSGRTILGSHFDEYLGDIEYFDLQNGPPYLCEFKNDFTDTNFSNSSKLFENFGRLLAFATCFGLLDLHLENLNIRNEYIQILDIECVLFFAESPADTLLIPNRASNSEKNLFRKLQLQVGEYSIEMIEKILRGLYQEFLFFKSNNENILEILSKEQEVIDTVPIRVLLRPSMHYREDFPKIDLKFPFLEEEQIQLSRGDIPYFFGYSGRPNIHYYSDKITLAEVSSKSLLAIQQKLDRSFQSLESILSEQRIQRVFKQSLALTTSRFVKYNEPLRVSSELFDIDFDGRLLRIESDSLIIQSKVF